MLIYADYEFYTKVYGGGLDKDKFESLSIQASQYIRYITTGRSEQFCGDEVRYAMCSVVDVYADFIGSTYQGRVVQSENNDGYSVSFVTEGSVGELTEQVRDRKAYQALRKWLLGTGLLSRKVGGCHDH